MADVTSPSNFSVDACLMDNLKANIMEKVKSEFSEAYISNNEIVCLWNKWQILHSHQSSVLPCLLLSLFEVIFQHYEVNVVLNELFTTLPFINSV